MRVLQIARELSKYAMAASRANVSMISLGSVVGIGLALGYFIGFMAKDMVKHWTGSLHALHAVELMPLACMQVFTTDVETAISSNSVKLQEDGSIPLLPAGKQWPGACCLLDALCTFWPCTPLCNQESSSSHR